MGRSVVIVGAGHAAAECCAALVQGGFDGSITMIGQETYLPYQRPPLSKAYLMGETEQARLFLRDRDFYAEHRVDLKLGVRAVRIDPTSKSVDLFDGQRLSYDDLVLLTGARVRLISCPGANLPGVYYMRTIDDADRLSRAFSAGRHLVVIGGGYIGLEVAASARKSGLSVTVLERLPRLLARVASEPFATQIAALHETQDVDVRCDVGVARIAGDTSAIGVVLEDGTEISTDHVVVGIGVIANSELAESADLQCDDGILVDAFGRTSDPAIYAAGDVARFYHHRYGSIRLESVQNAVEQAKLCAHNILGREVRYERVPWFWSDQYDGRIQIAGLLVGSDKMVERRSREASAVSFWHYASGKFIAVEALNDARSYMMGKRWLAEGVTPEPARIADPEIDIKDVV